MLVLKDDMWQYFMLVTYVGLERWSVGRFKAGKFCWSYKITCEKIFRLVTLVGLKRWMWQGYLGL